MTAFALGVMVGALAYPAGKVAGLVIGHLHNRPTHAFGA